MKRIPALTFTFLLALAEPALAESATGEPTTTEALDAEKVVAVEVDAAGFPEQRAELAQNFTLELRRRILAEGDKIPAGAVLANDRVVFVELRPGSRAEDDVLVRIEVRAEGKTLAESKREMCLACNDAQVAEFAMPFLLPLLPSFPPPPAPPKREPPKPERVEPSAVVDQPGKPKRPLLIGGATALGVGVAGLGAGIALIVLDERVVSPAGSAELEVVKYRDPGIAVTAVGGVATITGAVLLGLAFRDKAGGVAAAPVVSPSFVGIGAVGRF